MSRVSEPTYQNSVGQTVRTSVRIFVKTCVRTGACPAGGCENLRENFRENRPASPATTAIYHGKAGSANLPGKVGFAGGGFRLAGRLWGSFLAVLGYAVLGDAGNQV